MGMEFIMTNDERQNIHEREQKASEFERHAGRKQTGIVREFVAFLLHNKKWWLTPIIVVLLLLGLLIALGGTGATPFIYTLF
jgi:hypothetical protein